MLGYAERLRATYNTGVEYSNLEIQAEEIGWKLGLLLAANIGLFVIGVWYQFTTNRDRNHKKGF
jgi:predicted outer membrane lipoprotein